MTVNPTYLLPLGTRIRHTIADQLTGEIVGYGTLTAWSDIPQQVYLVKVDRPTELKTKKYASISIITMNAGHVQKEHE